jgi:hypothetical protein
MFNNLSSAFPPGCWPASVFALLVAKWCAAHTEVVMAGIAAAVKKDALDPWHSQADEILTGEGEIRAVNEHWNVLEAMLLSMGSKLIGLGPFAKVNATDCNPIPENVPLPLQFREYGCIQSAKNASSYERQVAMCNNETEAYKAYADWCAPRYCIVMEKKKPMELATNVLSTLGGLWISVTTICFTILWSVINAVMRSRNTSSHSSSDAVSLQQGQQVPLLQQQVETLQQQVLALSAMVVKQPVVAYGDVYRETDQLEQARP